MKRFIVFLLVALSFLLSCSETAEKESVYWVNSYKVDCEGVSPMSCLQVIKADDYHNLQWENFYRDIEGFEFEPGYLYQIVVAEAPVKDNNVKADDSDVKYKLKKVLQKIPDPKLKINDIWVLESISGNELSKLSEDLKMPELEFNLAKMSYNGHDGCNSFFGTISRADEDKLELNPGGTTMKMCGDMNLSNDFNERIIKIRGYLADGLKLYLKDANGEDLMVLKKVD